MANDIIENLKRLEFELVAMDAPILQRLSPGLGESQIIEHLRGIDLPQEVFDLYRWKNGTTIKKLEAIGQAWIINMGVFMSLERAMESYGKRAGGDEFWTKGKFPLFESRGGDYFLIDIDPTSPSYRKIQYYFLGAVDFDVIITKYDSLESLIFTVTECFKQRAYSYDPSNQELEVNPKLERSIGAQYNPRSEFWNLFKHR